MEFTLARTIRVSLVIAMLAAATAAAGSAATPGTARATRANGSVVLTGKWTGVLTGSVNGSVRRERITIVVNARQTAGSWKVSSSCRGSLTLHNISDGYHHYRRHLASGASCRGGDIDCLQRDGANVIDSVTPRAGGWARNGTLHRVRSG